MNTFSISNEMGTATVTVRVFGGQYCRMVILADFLPLEQKDFMDALDRAYRFESLKKDGEGGVSMTFGFRPEQRATLMEDIAEMFADNYHETYRSSYGRI